MALPPGSSPIHTAVLQLSRDLQHAVSKAKTSLSAVVTHTRAGHTGSDSALPTAREHTLSKQPRNLGSESVISSPTILAAVDVARACSLPALPDKTEDSNTQPGESDARGYEGSVTAVNVPRGDVGLSRQNAFHGRTHVAFPVPHAAREAENMEKMSLEMEGDDVDERHTLSSNTATSYSGRCSAEPTPLRRASANEGDAGESLDSAEQALLSSKRKKKPLRDHNGTTRWLHFASPAGSSASLLAPRSSGTPSSSSVLSSGCSPSTPGMFERASGTRYPYQCSSLLENASPASVGDFQDVSGPPRRQVAVAAASQNIRGLGVADSRHHFQRKKLSSPLACCATGSSPCGPPPLSVARLIAAEPQQQRKAGKPSLHVEGAEKDALRMARLDRYGDNSNHNCNFKEDSYTSRYSGANPANSRLAEVENKWFFVDILGDAPSFVEEIPTQQNCYSAAAATVGNTVARLALQAQTEQLGTSDNTCVRLSREASGSNRLVEGSSTVLLPAASGCNTSEVVSVLANTLLSDYYVEDPSKSPSECDKSTVSGHLLNTLEEEIRGTTFQVEQAFDTEKKEELPRSEQLQNAPQVGTQHEGAGRLHEERVHREQLVLQQLEQEDERAQDQCRCRAQQESGAQLLPLATEVSSRLALGGRLPQQTDGECSSSCSSVREAADGVGELSERSSTAASSTASSRKQVWDQMYQLHSRQPLLHLSPGQQHILKLPHSQQLEMPPPQQEGPQRQLVGSTGLGAGTAVLRAAFRSSVERSSGSGATEGALVGRRRHRMQKAEGTTSFASLEAMVEFVRNSVSLYGSTALEGVTFHVPAEDAESLVAALEETLPYSWRDLRAAAFEALKPLTALIVGRFVLVQLPSLLLELAGGVAAENAAAAAATAAAEASGFSAVLAVAPWLIVFGGCVYAIIRGAQALHASRRAQFIIREEGEPDTSILQQLLCADGRPPDVSGAVVAEATAASPDGPKVALAAGVATPTETTDLLRAAAPFPTASTVVLQPPEAEILQTGAAAAQSASALEELPREGAEDVRAATEEVLRSDVSEGPSGEEKHPLLQLLAAEERNRTSEMATVGCRRVISPRGGSNSESEGSRRRESSSSRSSASIVDLLDVAVSRRNSEEKREDKDLIEDMQWCSGENVDANGNEIVGRCDRALRRGNRGVNSNDDTTRSSRTSRSRTQSSSSRDAFSGNIVERSTGRQVTPLQSDNESSAGAAKAPVVDEPPATAAAAEEIATVFQDPSRRLQEEEALRQQLLTCSADWREKNFSFNV